MTTMSLGRQVDSSFEWMCFSGTGLRSRNSLPSYIRDAQTLDGFCWQL